MNTMMRPGIAADHSGCELKAYLTKALKADGYEKDQGGRTKVASMSA
jgi:ribose 5-phosphate isomerase RpiB